MFFLDGVNLIHASFNHQFPHAGLADQGSAYNRLTSVLLITSAINSPTADVQYLFSLGISNRITFERVPHRH
jgi:hypothetical protein